MSMSNSTTAANPRARRPSDRPGIPTPPQRDPGYEALETARGIRTRCHRGPPADRVSGVTTRTPRSGEPTEASHVATPPRARRAGVGSTEPLGHAWPDRGVMMDSASLDRVRLDA